MSGLRRQADSRCVPWLIATPREEAPHSRPSSLEKRLPSPPHAARRPGCGFAVPRPEKHGVGLQIERRACAPALRWPRTASSSGAIRATSLEQCRVATAKRRRWATSHALKTGLRSISRPSRASPRKSPTMLRNSSMLWPPDSSLRRPRDGGRVHEPIGKIEGQRIALGVDAGFVRIVHQGGGFCSDTSAARRADRWVHPTTSRKARCARSGPAPGPGERGARAPCAMPAARPRRRSGAGSRDRAGAAPGHRRQSVVSTGRRIPWTFPRCFPRSLQRLAIRFASDGQTRSRRSLQVHLPCWTTDRNSRSRRPSCKYPSMPYAHLPGLAGQPPPVDYDHRSPCVATAARL